MEEAPDADTSDAPDDLTETADDESAADAAEESVDQDDPVDSDPPIEPAPQLKRDTTSRDAAPTPSDPVTAVVTAAVRVTQSVVSVAVPSPWTPTPSPAPAAFARTAAVAEPSTPAIELTPTAAPGFTGVVTRLVASVLAPFFTPGPETPPAPALMWAVLALGST